MMSRHDDELSYRKRELHRRIERSRRRVGGRCRAVEQSAHRLLSWRTYVARYPGWSAIIAMGAGLTAAGLFRPARVSQWLGRSLIHQALGGLRHRLWSDLQNAWNRSTPDKEAKR